jgi:signal transduction histidine kinase
MPELARQARLLATTWRGDLVLGLATALYGLTVLSVGAERGLRDWPALWCALPLSAAVATRRTWPLAAAALASAAALSARPFDQTGIVNGWFSDPFLVALFLICYSLGVSTGLVTGLAGVIVLTASAQVETGPFVPIIYVVAVASWVAGQVALSRQRMTAQLQARNAELRAEQEQFAAESVRYERTRIARELHDIVAHCLSVMVVQASAGQRVSDSDQDGMALALASVAQAAAQAQEEIGRLVDLLGAEPVAGSSASLEMIDELARRAAATGLQVSCQLAGSLDELGPEASRTAYRVVQEAVTNALKHAPGAPVTVTVEAQGSQVAVAVRNAAPRGRPSELEGSGGQFGLAAMRERVAACGGRLTAGPSPDGGWQVLALLPQRTGHPGG